MSSEPMLVDAPRTHVYALASGSSGNAVLIKHGSAGLLLDAGVAARTLGDALARRGVAKGALAGIMLTHEHTDHILGAGALSRRMGAPIVANRATLDAVAKRGDVDRSMELATGSETRLGPFTVRSFAVPHDAADPVGYLIACGAETVFHATDVGGPTDEIRRAMRAAHLCILEANHDPYWLEHGPYPPAMKERIRGALGHLSNEQCADLVAERLDAGGPASFWLAHLSRVNNSPRYALNSVRARVAGLTAVQGLFAVALRDRPSLEWNRTGAVQLSLV